MTEIVAVVVVIVAAAAAVVVALLLKFVFGLNVHSSTLQKGLAACPRAERTAI